MNKLVLSFVAIAFLANFTFGQNNTTSDSLSKQKEKPIVNYKHSIEASLWMLYNFSSESADYYLLTYGYQLT